MRIRSLGSLSRKLFHRPTIFFLTGCIALSGLGIGLPALLDQYNRWQARTPHALASQSQPANAPAADALPASGKATALPPDIQAQLDSDRARAATGKPRDLHRIQKLDDNRTANDTTYLNADGSRTLEHSVQATSYRDSAGKWQDVDASLTQDSADGKWKTRANSWQARFGTATSQGIEIAKDGQTFSLTPVAGSDVAPTITGTAPNQIITYRNVWQGIDLQYMVYGSELKETIIIKSRVAPTQFKFASTGASLSPDRTGEAQFVLDGALAGFKISAPTVGTFNKGVIDGSLVTQTIAGGQLTLTLDAAWLSQRAFEEFPVVVDPTVVAYSVWGNYYRSFKSDGFVCYPGQGCGNSTGNASGYYWHTNYHTDVPQLAGMYIYQSSLYLQMPAPDGVHYWGVTAPKTIYVNRSTGDCYTCLSTDYGTTWGSIGTSGTIDITPQYQAAIDNNNLGTWMMVTGEQTPGVESYKFFDSSQTRTWFNYDQLPAPSLLGTGTPTPADGGVAVNTQPTFQTGSVLDGDGPGPTMYRYLIGTSKSGAGLGRAPSIAGIVADSGYTDVPKWTVSDNVLQDGTTYYWQTATWDSWAGVPGNYSPVYSFKVDLRNGKDATQAFDATGPVSTDLATGNLTTSAASHSVAALGGSLGASLDYNSPQRSRQGLVGEYWNDPSATRVIPATPAQVTRVDTNVDFNWGTGSPSTGIITTDNFLARWSGYFVAPQTKTYKFGLTSDDRGRIYIGGSLYLDAWNTSLPTDLYGGDIALTAGQVIAIKYEYAEYGGSASTRLQVKSTDGVIAPQVIKPEWLQTGVRPIATPHGLVGRYYPGATLPGTATDTTGTFLVRTDPTPSLDWSTGSPVPGGPADNFVVRWTGYFKAPQTGSYKFGGRADDGLKVIVDGATQVDTWSSGATSSPVWAASALSFTAGQTKAITVEYKELSGGAGLGLYVDGPGIDKGLPVPSNWLLPMAQVLPDGWNLGQDADGDLGYDYAYIGQNSVNLRDATGETHEYKYANGGFTPPVGEAGQMVRNGDGTITLQDSDGRTYVFGPDGTLKLATTPADDRQPAALQYSYAGSPARLTQITDGVTTARWAKLHYWGDAGFTCPTISAGASFSSIPASGYLCQVETSDGQTTNLLYTTDSGGHYRLGRLEHPGAELSDYGYLTEDTTSPNSCPGCLSTLRDSLASDAITAGLRTQNTDEKTDITYDALGRASAVTMPAATAGATRQGRSYDYQSSASPAYTLTHVTGATEPNGFARKVTYDTAYRTTADTDVANLTTATAWDVDAAGAPRKDLVLSNTDPAGLKSTTIYDYAGRPTDQYGPAPSTWFGTDRQPLTTPTDYTGQIPHTQTGYDEASSSPSLVGLAAAYYDVTTASNGTGTATKLLLGAPRSHATGVGPASGDVVKTWGTSQPITPTQTTYGWGLRLTGFVKLPETGNHTFRLDSDDGARLFIDDGLVLDDWTDGPFRTHPTSPTATGVFNNSTANSYHRLRIDYYNKAVGTTLDTDAQVALYKTAPGGSATTVLGSLLNPAYGLATSQTTYDSSAAVGTVTATTNYGSSPELGLAGSNTLDAGGLGYTSSSTYETLGTGHFLRQTDKALPGGPTGTSTTHYDHYSAGQTLANPCVVGSPAVDQAGLLRLKTEADPDNNSATTTPGVNAGRLTETVYDAAGRVIATRYNADPWTCTTYDARGRVTQVQIPAIGSAPARTITNNWAVGTPANPFIVSTSDASGTIATTSDLLGRTTSYTDANGQTTTSTYDNLGRLASRSGPLGFEEFVYDNYNRLTSQKLDSVVQAVGAHVIPHL